MDVTHLERNIAARETAIFAEGVRIPTHSTGHESSTNERQKALQERPMAGISDPLLL
jgi:hypothetical protein